MTNGLITSLTRKQQYVCGKNNDNDDSVNALFISVLPEWNRMSKNRGQKKRRKKIYVQLN